MKSLLEGPSEPTDQREHVLLIERRQDPFAAPAAGSLVLHGALFGLLLFYGVISGLFHHNLWGNPGEGGAIQVTLVSDAIPLPHEEQNQNVLMTDTPSKAPAPPEPKAKETVDETAIPISGKDVKPKQEPARKTQQKQPPPPPDNRAHFGEQSGSVLPRATMAQNSASAGPVSVNDGNFSNLFGYYILGIQRKMLGNWNKAEVDPHTPKGTRAYIQFTIHRDGTLSNIHVDQPSAYPTLDTACLRTAQRVDSFGALPAAYNQSTVLTSYYCEFD
ncbi:MAG: TonB family protein [Terracidiphilus sp.]|jgi:protein TonB